MEDQSGPSFRKYLDAVEKFKQANIAFLKIFSYKAKISDVPSSAPINSRLNVVLRSPTPFGMVQNGCWPSRGSQLHRVLPSHKLFFSRVAPERPHKGSTQLL